MPRGKPFKPGQSGNPAGRKVGSKNDATVWREAYASAVSADDIAEVSRVLAEAAKKGAPWAVQYLMDRSMGRPVQGLEVSGELTIDKLLVEMASK